MAADTNPPRYAGQDGGLELRTGALRADLENGTLRDIAVGDAEALHQVYVAIRDGNWGTVPGILHDLRIDHRPDGFLVRFRSAHVANGISFTWDGTIDADGGTLVYRMDGRADCDFQAGRIGFCLLHPLSLAGVPVTVRTADGERQLTFPVEIAGSQPLPEMSGMAHDVGVSGRLDIACEGDLFETEDQRNWTDASYKTYCTPLRLPFPRQIRTGDRITQTVTITANGPATFRERKAPTRTTVTLDTTTLLPPLPALGLGVHSQGGPLDDAEIELVRRLRPEHLRASLNLADPGWPEALASASAAARAVGVVLDLDVTSHNRGADLAALIPQLGRNADVVRRFCVFDSGTWVTGEELARRTRELLTDAHLTIALGGGSMANYAEFNRASLPLSVLDIATFPINPQVHAFDDRSIIETLQTQGQIVASARRRCGGLPLSIGPVTLRPRFNPVATGAEPSARPDELPTSVDVRQAAPITAAWTIASALALEGADSVTYYETAGWRGTFSRHDDSWVHPRFPAPAATNYPVYAAIHALADLAARPRLAAHGGEERVAVLAVKTDDAVDVLVANMTAHERTVVIEADGEPVTVALAGYGTSTLRMCQRGHQ